MAEPKMVRVRLKNRMTGKYNGEPGDIIEMPEAYAIGQIKSGTAEWPHGENHQDSVRGNEEPEPEDDET